MSQESLRCELEKISKLLGGDFFGVADLTLAYDYICNLGGSQVEFVRKFPRAISIGIRLLDSVVDELYKQDPASIYAYQNHCYKEVDGALGIISLRISKKLAEAGFKAYPIPTHVMHIDTEKLIGTVPSKIVARLAGLGWVGKSCLFINPQYGPRVRLKTILIDAPFQPGKIMENRCDDCRECVDACPADAISNSFDLTRDKHYSANTCMEYGRQRGRSLKWSIGNPCGLCVYICPYGGTEKKPKPKKVAITQTKRITAFSKADTHYRLATA